MEYTPAMKDAISALKSCNFTVVDFRLQVINVKKSKYIPLIVVLIQAHSNEVLNLHLHFTSFDNAKCDEVSCTYEGESSARKDRSTVTVNCKNPKELAECGKGIQKILDYITTTLNDTGKIIERINVGGGGVGGVGGGLNKGMDGKWFKIIKTSKSNDVFLKFRQLFSGWKDYFGPLGFNFVLARVPSKIAI